MEYNDEQVLSINDYEIMAKAYASELKKRGFMVVQVDSGETKELAENLFEKLLKIKSLLFSLGGFLNTSQFYSLNERQIKKLALLFDANLSTPHISIPRDKTKCFLLFLSTEFSVIKNLIELAEKSNYESELKKLIDARLSLLSQILSV